MPVPSDRILAASPVFGGPMSQDYRVIMWRETADKIVVHDQAVELLPDGTLKPLYEMRGNYFNAWDSGELPWTTRAVLCWQERTTRELARGPRCLMVDGVHKDRAAVPA